MSETLHKDNVLVRYLKKYWYFIFLSVIFSTTAGWFNLELPELMQELVDVIIPQFMNQESSSGLGDEQLAIIYPFLLKIAYIFLMAGIFDLFRTLTTQTMSTNLIYNIRNDMYRALQRQSYSFYDKNRTGNLMSKTTSDVNVVRQFLTNQFQSFIKNILFFIIISVKIWSDNWKLALLFMSLTPPLYVLMAWYRKNIRPVSKRMYQSRGELFSILQENIAGVRVVKAFGRQKMEKEKYLKQNDEYIDANLGVIKLQTIYGPLSEFLTQAGSVMLVFVGGYLVIAGELSIGAVIASFAYFALVYDPIRNVVGFFNQLAANKAALDRVNEVLENRSDIEIADKPIDPSRVLGDLYIRLLKDKQIIMDIDDYLNISEEEEISNDISDGKSKILKDSSILPKGLKSSAVESVYFKNNVPIIFSESYKTHEISNKIVLLTKSKKFRAQMSEASSMTFSKREAKSFDAVEFIINYFLFLLKNEKLMLNVYSKLSQITDEEISEIKEFPAEALFNYISYFDKDEKEIDRIKEVHHLLYSPKQHDHAAIAKKYDRMLVKKGVLEPSRKETLVGSTNTTNAALSFLKLEKELIGKEFARKHQKELEKNELKKQDQLNEIPENPAEQLKPIQINTKYEDVSWSPVKTSNLIGHVNLVDVFFAYEGETEGDKLNYVLSNINLDVAPGETVAFLGATGSGKSTLINLLPRFYDTTKGNIYIDGINIRELDLKDYRKQIGIVAQETFLFSRSIKENITYGSSKINDDDVLAVAKIAKINEFILSLPDKYDTVIGERGQTLSGGQKQRIAIARALLLDPAILILDDSLSAVDVDTEYAIQEVLDELFKGRTTFIITQRLSTIRNADRIFVLDDGAIVEGGTHEELLKLNGIYTKIYQTLFKKRVRLQKEYEQIQKNKPDIEDEEEVQIEGEEAKIIEEKEKTKKTQKLKKWEPNPKKPKVRKRQ